MTHRILRISSLVLLLAVTAISVGRVVCLLPCAAAETAPSKAEHCGHDGSDAASRLTGFKAQCADCNELRIPAADRLTTRGNGVPDLTVLTLAPGELRFSPDQTGSYSFSTGPPPGARIPIDLHIPLRI